MSMKTHETVASFFVVMFIIMFLFMFRFQSMQNMKMFFGNLVPHNVLMYVHNRYSYKTSQLQNFPFIYNNPSSKKFQL
jgi:hypothetical protein